MRKIITQLFLWVLMLAPPLLVLAVPETFSVGAPQLIGWSFFGLYAAALIGVGVQLHTANSGEDPDAKSRASEKVIERYRKMRKMGGLHILSAVRTLFAATLYFVLGLGWLAFFLAVAVMAVLMVTHLSNKLARELLFGETEYGDSGVGEGILRKQKKEIDLGLFART